MKVFPGSADSHDRAAKKPGDNAMNAEELEMGARPPQEPDPERLARLEKQETSVPPALAVHDPDLIRLLAIAGAGGSY